MSKHDQELRDIERRLFQIAEALSAEERNRGGLDFLQLMCIDFMFASFLRLPTQGYTFVFPLGYALSRGCSLPLSRLHPSGFRSAL